MRMYWAKQIIGWTADAETALDHCVRLNNRWELDAVDPNSYAGIVWNFGRHDQGWKERAIWGKVRYMNDAGLKRKFNMAAYVSKVELLVKRHGLPGEIAALHERSRKRGGGQSTIEEMLGAQGGGAAAKRRRKPPARE
jgi:deoxyribodipyrimidine photo-lyase